MKSFFLFIIFMFLSATCFANDKQYIMDHSYVSVIHDASYKEHIISSYNQKLTSSTLISCGTVIEIIMGTAHVSYTAGACTLKHKSGETEQVRFCGETGVKIYKIELYRENHSYEDKEITDLINFFQNQCYI